MSSLDGASKLARKLAREYILKSPSLKVLRSLRKVSEQNERARTDT